MILFYIIFGFLSTAFSFLVNGLFIKFSKNLGMRNVDENAIRWGSRSKPALGGISFFLNFLFAITFYFMLSEQHSILENVKKIHHYPLHPLWSLWLSFFLSPCVVFDFILFYDYRTRNFFYD